MAKKRGAVSSEQADEMFTDVIDRITQSDDDDDDSETTQTPPQQPVEQVSSAADDDKGETTMRVTVYLTAEELDELDRVVMQRRQETKRSPRRSHLIREAIQVWLTQQ